jgi:hypothetical protein
MLRNRNTLILAGAALVAFVVFLVFGAEERGAASREGSGGLLGWFGKSGPSDATPGVSESGGEGSQVQGRKAREARRKLLQRKNAKKKEGPADPNLLQRMTAGLGGLIPTGTPDASREGVLTQNFRGGSAGTVVRGGARRTNPAGSVDDVEEPASTDPNQCGSPKIRKSVFDLQTHPQMRAAFDVPSKSNLISQGFGERFTVGGGPAFVIYIPQSKRGSAGAIFDNRFLVTLSGECIPDRQFLKSLLHQ